MKNKYLNFISDEHFLNCIANLHSAYIKAKNNISKKSFYSNKVDTIKLTFDSKFNDIDEEKLIEAEILRQIDKSINNSIGTFHEQILGGIDAFISPNYPLLGESGVHLKIEESRLYRTESNEPFHADLHLSDKVFLWRIFPGINLENLPEIPKIKVLILQVFGSGTIFSNKKTEEILQKIKNNGTEIVVISQCISGGISIGKYNNSNVFKKIGAISGRDITAESALAKAMHIIDNPRYENDFAENFSKNLRGEISEIEE